MDRQHSVIEGKKGMKTVKTASAAHHVNESNYKLLNKARGPETLFRF